MGQEQISSSKTNKIAVSEFPVENKAALDILEHLLKTKVFKKLSHTEAEIEKEG